MPESADPKRAAYSAATSRLRDTYRDAFNDLLKEEMAARGQEWAPRPTERDKARATLANLLTEFPELRDELTT